MTVSATNDEILLNCTKGPRVLDGVEHLSSRIGDMKERRASPVLCVAVLVGATLGPFAALSIARAQAHDEDLLAQARAAYQQRHIATQDIRAVELYQLAIDAQSTYVTLWEGARAASHLGQNAWAKAKRSKRAQLFEKGLSWAEGATKARPRGAEGHYYVAVLTGLHAQQRSFLHQMTTARSIRRAAERALKLDPSIECGGPPQLLGMYYRQLPAAFGGDNTQSKRYLQQALRHCPNAPELHYLLAECLHTLGDDAGARREAQWVLDHPPSSPRDRRDYQQIKRDTDVLLSDMD